MKLLVLVVVYRCEWTRSATLQSLLKTRAAPLDLDFLIWDNSPASTFDKGYVEQAGKRFGEPSYHWDGSNTPLSQIYNIVSRRAHSNDYLLILDDDTNICEDFFLELSRSINDNSSIDLFLPIIRSGKRILSPGSYFIAKGRQWTVEKRGIILTKGLVAISSGLCISMSYLRDLKKPFNEELDFYGIDTDFMLSFSKFRAKAFVTRSTLSHSSALLSRPNKNEFLWRFQNLRKSWFIINRDHPFRKLFLHLYATYVSAKYAIIFRDWRFLSEKGNGRHQ